jgi:hypothetical protein
LSVELGGCKNIRLALDITTAAINNDPMTIFYSINTNQELFDFIDKGKDQTVHAFQATLGRKHTAPQHLIGKLRNKLGSCRLVLYYLIKADGFNGFVTDPVNPEVDDLTSVWQLLILPHLNTEQVSSPPASQL